VRLADIAADRRQMADESVSMQLRRVLQDRVRPCQEGRGLQIGNRGQSTDGEAAVASDMPETEAGYAYQRFDAAWPVDQQIRSTGDYSAAIAILGDGGQGFIHRFRPDIFSNRECVAHLILSFHRPGS
jgi:hypothetical protein